MTIIEIANHLGVSPSTVSRALNNSYQISKATKKRIDDFIKEVNYRPNPQAASLKRGATKTIAVIIPDISNYFFTLALNAIEEIANDNKYHVLIYQTHDSSDRETEIINQLYNGRVDGVIISVAGGSYKDFTAIENLSKSIPVVFFDRVIDQPGMPSITCDDYESGLKGTQHLIDKKCKDILFIGISKQLSVTNVRLQGYTDALNNNGIIIKKGNILLCKNENIADREIANVLCKLSADGVFSTVERYTLLLYAQCQNLGIKIPEQLKIISFFNSPTAALLCPPLSSISHPAAKIGKAAAESLFLRLKKQKNYVQKNTVFDCTFHYRKSSL